MGRSTLLGALTLRFSSHPENLATEALVHLLRSPMLAEEFGRIVKELAPECAVPSYYRSQAGKEDAIPDIVGLGANGAETVIVENKFWAGLTDAQPCFYLQRLAARPSLVLFIVPAARVSIVWPELLRRCSVAGVAAQVAENRLDGRVAKIGNAQTLALASWRVILSRLHTAARDAKNDGLASDVEQLIGLCDEMDTQAFLPLRSEELTSDTAKRVVQFVGFVDTLTNTLVEEGQASKKGLRATGSKGWYGQYFFLHGYCCQLSFHALHWMNLGASPLWLRVANEAWQVEHAITDYLRSNLPDVPVTHSVEGQGTLVPIYLRTGLEEDALLRDAAEQLKRVSQLLAFRPRQPANVGAPREEANG